MSKIFNNKSIAIRYYGKRIIAATYKGLKLIWQAVRSCFGAGYWNQDQPWNNEDGWKNES